MAFSFTLQSSIHPETFPLPYRVVLTISKKIPGKNIN